MKARPTDRMVYASGEATPQRRGFIQNRMQNFGWTMVVMGASFILYYLGLFGGVSGPLQPARIGERLAALGFSDRHLLVIFLSLTVLALSWNWIYNAINRLLGRHMRCTFQRHEGNGICAAPISKNLSDRKAGLYVCAAGHSSTRFDVHVIKKGTVGHFLWMMWLVFSAIVFYLS